MLTDHLQKQQQAKIKAKSKFSGLGTDSSLSYINCQSAKAGRESTQLNLRHKGIQTRLRPLITICASSH